MESALGKAITPMVRSELVKIVQHYFRGRAFELSAPFQDDVLERIGLIKEAANRLQQALLGIDSEGSTQAVREKIAVEIGQDTLLSIEEMLPTLVYATVQAEEYFKAHSDDGFSDGDAWQEMARSLKELMRTHGLPQGAAQNSDTTKSPAGSPFVKFVQCLQDSFPDKSLRRHHLGTPFALAKEINRAVRDGRMRNGT